MSGEPSGSSPGSAVPSATPPGPWLLSLLLPCSLLGCVACLLGSTAGCVLSVWREAGEWGSSIFFPARVLLPAQHRAQTESESECREAQADMYLQDTGGCTCVVFPSGRPGWGFWAVRHLSLLAFLISKSGRRNNRCYSQGGIGMVSHRQPTKAWAGHPR